MEHAHGREIRPSVQQASESPKPIALAPDLNAMAVGQVRDQPRPLWDGRDPLLKIAHLPSDVALCAGPMPIPSRHLHGLWE